MHLKSIELHGFKSFADRVKLEFQPGINVIVGPNGSGKSNIIDAVRWVLGEQSIKTLRGYKLQDVIFAGSNKKRPMGMAEVAVTIDNSDQLIPLDYSEISFTRRTFRSGESEFYINKVPCRLKDIQDILMDSGVGKDGYSIISQGKIDEILNYHPSERRIIFEEAAGIMKHKMRKKEAEKKLEETMSNISRIDDLIIELEGQLNPLAVQRETALKYKELVAAQKEVDVNLLLKELEIREKKLTDLRNDILQYKDCSKKLQDTIDLLKKQIAEGRDKQKTLEETLEKSQQSFYSIGSQQSEFEKDYQLANAEKEKLEKENQDIVKRIEQEKEKLHKSEKLLNAKSDELDKKIKILSQLEVELDTYREKLMSINEYIEEKQKIIESAKGDVIDLLNYASEKRNIISGLKTMRQNLEKRFKQIQDEKSQLDRANDLTNKEIFQTQEKINRLKSECSQLEIKIEELKKNLNEKAKHLDDWEKEDIRKQQELTDIKSRMTALQDVVDNYEGYQSGVRNLLIAIKKKQFRDSGIFGTVAELISVKQKYETAIECALGYAMQNIVCDKEENAKRAIEFLKRHNCGRATFLPLSSVKPRMLNSNELKMLSASEYISVAIELVSYDDKFFPVLGYLLGRVVVTRSLDQAIRVARKFNFGIKVVTIQGELLAPGGSISGGSQRRSVFLLSRKRQLSEYKKRIDELSKNLDEIKKLKVNVKAEIQEIEGRLSKYTEELYNAKSEIAVLQNQLQEKQRVLEERLSRKQKLEEERLHIVNETKEILSQIEIIEADIGDIDSKSITNQDKVKQLQTHLEEKKKTKDKISNYITELKVKLASCRQEEKAISQSIEILQTNIKSHAKEINNLEQKIKENRELMEKVEKRVLECKNNVEELSCLKQKYKDQIQLLRQRVENAKSNLESVQTDLNKFEQDKEQIQKKLHNASIKEATIVTELNQIKNQLFERYSLTVPDALKMKKDLGNIDKMKSELSSIKRKIESLGPVNLQAIEDYDKLKSRYDFLKAQREDLLNAKANLDRLIEDITGKMEQMLLSAINVINDNFNKIFSELFEGGRAQLIIEGEGNILECGIKISAQPPGKKLQSISLLSGGERALTAIALLFAILNTKATPFCIMDEIEAALDDANSVRFTKYLKKVSKQTQFIIITHRKTTMEIADALYGISMEDTATSKVLAVKME